MISSAISYMVAENGLILGRFVKRIFSREEGGLFYIFDEFPEGGGLETYLKK